MPVFESHMAPRYVLLPFWYYGVRNGAISIMQRGFIIDYYKVNAIGQWGKIMIIDIWFAHTILWGSNSFINHNEANSYALSKEILRNIVEFHELFYES